MNEPFATVDFNSQLNRSLSKVYRRFASVGECLAVAERVKDGDTDSWFEEWNSLAERLEGQGRDEAAVGRFVSARDAYSRAAEYYRQSTFFHRIDLDCEELQQNWPRARDCFRSAMMLSPYSVTPIDIPFDGSSLHGYYLRVDSATGLRPTVIAPSGYDGTAEEAVILNGLSAVERGFNAVAFDGPGQGNTLYDPGRRLYMRPDWEHVLPEVVDFVLTLEGIDPDRLVAIGASFAGFLMPRGASSEPRLAALVADPGQLDMGAAIRARLPDQFLSRLNDDSPEAGAMFSRITEESEAARLMFEPRRAAHGQASLQGYLRDLMRYTSEGVVGSIQCPALICDNESDVVSAGQGELLAARLNGRVEFVRFSEAEGAGGHCEGSGREIYDQRVFAWLEGTLKT